MLALYAVAAKEEVTAVAFSPGGKTFVTVGANGTAALWSVATGHRVGALMSAGAYRQVRQARAPRGMKGR